MKSFLPNDIKDQNRKIIFDILLQEPQLAKVEISERTTMSFVTVSKVVDYFEQIGLVKVNGESREGSGGLGRKRVVYSFNPDSFMTVGIQIIGGEISAVLLNLYSEIVDTYDGKLQAAFYEEKSKEMICEAVSHFQETAQKRNARIIGLGIGVDGAINEARKSLRMRSSRNEEKDYFYQDILEYLEQHTGLSVVLENDVNASTIAEFGYLDRGEEEQEDMLFIALGEGIGAGLVLDKKLHRGHNAGVGEMEYMCFDTEYRKTPSAVGWLENKLNLDFLAEKFHYNFERPQEMNRKEQEESIDYIGKYLGLAVSNIVSLLDMKAVILSGKTIIAFPEKIAEKVREYVYNYIGWEIELSVSTKNNSTAIGAAMLSLEGEMTKIITG